jgi:hypothetical protein
VIDPETYECLHYEPVTGFPPKKLVRVPREVLEGHPTVEIRYDLLDCSIDICSVEVPSLFQDNFDYADIRRDFVHGVLTSDLLMKNIHCYVAREGYAARVQDTRSYDAVRCASFILRCVRDALTHAAARTSSRAGRFRSCRMTTTLRAKPTSSCVATAT